MKVLYSWLKEYVDIDIEPKELETKLFSAGFEVEGMEYLGENLEKVVVGQITSMEKYEGTHLQICHVNCGPMGEDHLILTGATNVFVGAKVPAALVGAKLPCGLDIQPRKMVDMIGVLMEHIYILVYHMVLIQLALMDLMLILLIQLKYLIFQEDIFQDNILFCLLFFN